MVFARPRFFIKGGDISPPPFVFTEEAMRNFNEITVWDWAVVIFCIFALLYFVVIAPAIKNANAHISDDKAYELTIEINKAFQAYYGKIDRDPTDSGCLMAERELRNDINSILFRYDFHNNFNDKLLDRRAAWLDASQFQD